MKWCRFLLPVLSLSFGMFRFNYTYRVKIRVHILVKLFTLNSNVLSDFNVRFYLSCKMFISKEAAMIFKLSGNICELVKSFTNYKKIYFSVYILSNKMIY